MRSYSIYEAKAKLSELLRQVKSGLEIVVTDRGRPVAKLIPFEAAETFEERLSELERSGILRGAGLFRAVSLGKKRGSLRRFLESRD